MQCMLLTISATREGFFDRSICFSTGLTTDVMSLLRAKYNSVLSHSEPADDREARWGMRLS